MSDILIPQRFLFRFEISCRRREPLWTARGLGLDETYRLADFAELEGAPSPFDIRAAWSEAGLGVAASVSGKKQAPWCRASRVENSDGLQLWIDTRNVQNIHRAGRFCHRLVFLPTGGGRRADQAVAAWLSIHRAREHPRPIDPEELKARSTKRRDGYLLETFIPARCLTGFDPAEHPRLGFNYAVVDRELGTHTLTAGAPMPYEEDPSLWATLELVEQGA